MLIPEWWESKTPQERKETLLKYNFHTNFDSDWASLSDWDRSMLVLLLVGNI